MERADASLKPRSIDIEAELTRLAGQIDPKTEPQRSECSFFPRLGQANCSDGSRCGHDIVQSDVACAKHIHIAVLQGGLKIPAGGLPRDCTSASIL